MDLDLISHISAAEKEALPPIEDANTATRLMALLGFDLGAFQPDLDIGIESFCLMIKAFPSYASSLPQTWRDVTYRWLECWIESSIPAAESGPVLAAIQSNCRPLLQQDEGELRSAYRVLAHLPTLDTPSVQAATAEQIDKAGFLVRQFCEERGDNDFSVKSLLMFASQLQALPFTAAAPHLFSFLEAGRALWGAQQNYDINEAIMDILDAAPDAETLAEALRPSQQTPFLQEMYGSAPHRMPGSVVMRGIQMAVS